MLFVIQPHGFVKIYQGFYPAFAAALAAKMNYPSLTNIHCFPAFIKHSFAKIQVFPVHKENFIKATDFAINLAAKHHRRSGKSLGGAGNFRINDVSLVLINNFVIFKNFSQAK